MMARRYAELELKKIGIAFWCLQLYTPKDVILHFDVCNFASWWLQLCILMVATLYLDACFFVFQKLPLCILMVATLHHDGCYFTLRKLQLCIPMVAFLHGFLHWSFCKPNLQHFSSSYWMSYILPPRILHSLRECTSFLTRIHFILYLNTLHSRKEWSVFSYWA